MFFCSLSGFAQQPAGRTATDFLKKFGSDFIEHIQNGKPESLRPYFADSLRLMPEFQKTVIGKKHALSYYKAFLERFGISDYRRETVEVLDLGERVVELGTFNLVLTLKSSGKTYSVEGKYQEFWQKSQNGKLALVTAAWNYSHEITIADQMRFSTVPATDVAMTAHLPINNNIRFELAALNRLQERTISEHDAKLWTRFFTDDAKYIYSGSPIAGGRKEIDDFFAEHVRHIPVFEKLDIRNDRVDHLGDYVVEYASHIAIVRSGDFSGVFTGKNVNIWRREKDGSLKIFREMAMYD